MDFSYHAGAFGAASAVLLGVVAQVHADSMSVEILDWQLQSLMEPTPSQLAAEGRGRVFIYDSLEIDQVNAALGQQFDRVENMMFVRINHLPPTGAGIAEVADDRSD